MGERVGKRNIPLRHWLLYLGYMDVIVGTQTIVLCDKSSSSFGIALLTRDTVGRKL